MDPSYDPIAVARHVYELRSIGNIEALARWVWIPPDQDNDEKAMLFGGHKFGPRCQYNPKSGRMILSGSITERLHVERTGLEYKVSQNKREGGTGNEQYAGVQCSGCKAVIVKRQIWKKSFNWDSKRNGPHYFILLGPYTCPGTNMDGAEVWLFAEAMKDCILPNFTQQHLADLVSINQT